MVEQGVVAEDADLLLRRSDRSGERVIAEDEGVEVLEEHVARIVGGHRELFDDDAAFAFELTGIEGGVRDHVEQQRGDRGQVGDEAPRVVAGEFLRRDRIRVPAGAVEGGGDGQGVLRRGALEEHVLEEVGGTGRRSRFVTRTGRDPDADGLGGESRHVLGDDGETTGEDGPSDRCVLPGVR